MKTTQGWTVAAEDPKFIRDSSDVTIATTFSHSAGQKVARDNAKRIVASVNACAGMPDGALSEGIVVDMFATLLEAWPYLPPSLGAETRLAKLIDYIRGIPPDATPTEPHLIDTIA
jgi:hypothetical protein